MGKPSGPARRPDLSAASSIDRPGPGGRVVADHHHRGHRVVDPRSSLDHLVGRGGVEGRRQVDRRRPVMRREEHARRSGWCRAASSTGPAAGSWRPLKPEAVATVAEPARPGRRRPAGPAGPAAARGQPPPGAVGARSWRGAAARGSVRRRAHGQCAARRGPRGDRGTPGATRGAGDHDQASTLAPALERPAERQLVGVLEVAPDRQPAGDPGHPDPEGREQPGEVHGGGLTLEVGVGAQDHLGDRPRRRSGPAAL